MTGTMQEGSQDEDEDDKDDSRSQVQAQYYVGDSVSSKDALDPATIQIFIAQQYEDEHVSFTLSSSQGIGQGYAQDQLREHVGTPEFHA